ncbi:MAG: hypothetical protein AAFV53_15285 [Myxococcota bacterium]
MKRLWFMMVSGVWFACSDGGDNVSVRPPGEDSATPRVERDCDDGLDGDGDGLVDCRDPDCVCEEDDCADGVDEDLDGQVDCYDEDCAREPHCQGEFSCDDGIDNDGDGLTDCVDAACARDPGCFESDCADGIDNDGDGLTDCASLECAAECAEDCLDGVDNDADGLIDCADADCWSSTGCERACVEGTLREVALGDTSTASDDFGAVGCGDEGGRDVALAWTAPRDGCYRFDTRGSTFDTVLRVHESCGLPAVGCVDDGTVAAASLTWDALTGDQLIVVVDGYDALDDGAFKLSVERTKAACHERACDDGFDDDLDGVRDCDDLDCDRAANCVEANCYNAFDDDGDGLVDCDDGDCAHTARCPDRCDDADLDDALGLVVTAKTTGWTDHVEGACGDAGAEDRTFQWRAPADGCYTLDVQADFDAVLRILSDCSGSEDVCDDDGGPGQAPRLSLEMRRGESALIVVDGASPFEAGTFSLAISEGCP